MEKMEFDSAQSLMRYFENVGIHVGPRSGPVKGTQDEKELFNLRQYLTTLATNDELKFPVKVVKSESPDFIITDGDGMARGLEVTEATTQTYQRDLTLSDRELDDEPKLVSLGRNGWRSDSAERETCSAILWAMRRKARKIKYGKYRSNLQHDLLIYVNVRAFFYDNAEVAGLLNQRAIRWNNQWSVLGSVSVILSRNIILDVTRNPIRLPISEYSDEA